MNLEITFALTTLFLLAVNCRKVDKTRRIKFEDCSDVGRGAIRWVAVNPCVKEPCIFQTNTFVKVAVSAIAPRDMTSGTLKAYLVGMDMPFPGFELDICSQVKCPINKGTPFMLTHKIKVPEVPGHIESEVKFITTTSSGDVLSCVKVHIGIDDGQVHLLPPVNAIEALKAFETFRGMTQWT